MRVALTLGVFAVAAAVGTVVIVGPRLAGSLDGGSQAGQLASQAADDGPGSRPTVIPSDPAARYWIQNNFSNLVMELPGEDVALGGGVSVRQWENLGTADQNWQIERVGVGRYVRITNALSHKVLAIRDDARLNGAALIVVDRKPGAEGQEWALEDARDGQVWILNRHSGRVLDIPGDDVGNKNGAAIQQWQRQDYAQDQRWLLVLR